MARADEEAGGAGHRADHRHAVRSARAIAGPLGHHAPLLDVLDVAVGAAREHLQAIAHPRATERLDLERACQPQLLAHGRDRHERLVQHAARERKLRDALVLQVVPARALHGDIEAQLFGQCPAPDAGGDDHVGALERLALRAVHTGRAAVAVALEAGDIHGGADLDAQLRARGAQAQHEVRRVAVRAVAVPDGAGHLVGEAGAAGAELIARQHGVRIAVRHQRLRLRLGVREVGGVHHHVQPAVAAVVAVDPLGGDDLLEEFERGEAHRAELVHAAVEPRLVAVAVEGPEPGDEVRVRPRADEERRVAIEHPLNAAPADARARERIVADREEPRVAAAGALADLLAVEDDDLAPCAGKEVGGGEPDDAGSDDDRPWSWHGRIVGSAGAPVGSSAQQAPARRGRTAASGGATLPRWP